MRSSVLLSRLESQHPGMLIGPVLNELWRMPLAYSQSPDALELEYTAAKNGVGIVDRSWKAALLAVGHDRVSFLQGMLSNDIAGLQPGHGCRAALLDTKGKIQATMIVRAFPHTLALICDPRSADLVAETLDRYIILEDVEIVDESDQWIVFGVVGPNAAKTLEQVTGTSNVGDIPKDGFRIISNVPASGVIVEASVGSLPGYELWLPSLEGAGAWDKLVCAGGTPFGWNVDEILRVEAGIPSWGSELDNTVLLPEVGIEQWASLTKGCYVGQEIVARIDARGHTNRVLRQITFDDAQPLQAGTVLVNPQDMSSEACRLTSVVSLPGQRGRQAALGFVRSSFDLPGVYQQWLTPDGQLVGASVLDSAAPNVKAGVS